MTFETTVFAGTPKSVVYFRLLADYAASTGIHRRSAAQRLPARRQTGHALRFADFAIDMTGSAADRIFIVRMMRKTKIGLRFITGSPDDADRRQ